MFTALLRFLLRRWGAQRFVCVLGALGVKRPYPGFIQPHPAWRQLPTYRYLNANTQVYVENREMFLRFSNPPRFAITEGVDQDTWQQWLREQNF